MYSLDINSSPINNLNNVHLWQISISFKSIVFVETEVGQRSTKLLSRPSRFLSDLFHLRDYQIIDFVWNSVVINFGIAQDHSIHKM